MIAFLRLRMRMAASAAATPALIPVPRTAGPAGPLWERVQSRRVRWLPAAGPTPVPLGPAAPGATPTAQERLAAPAVSLSVVLQQRQAATQPGPALIKQAA